MDTRRRYRVNAQPTAAAAGTIDVGGDLTVNRLGFGAMRITGPGIWGDPPSRDQAIATLRLVVELGVNFIDTADSYGPEVSETLIAEALYPYPDELVIATKGGLVRPGPGRWDADGRPGHLREACEGSLRRLRLEQIPLYQFHRPDPEVPLAESIGAIAELKNEGKIRHVGISNVSESQLREAQRIVPIVSIQNRYNASDRRSESLIDLCEQEQLVFLPWAPVQEAGQNPAVANAAERLGLTQHQVVLAWLLASSPQILPIPGTGSPRHAEENIAAASVALSPEEIEAISKGVLSARDLSRFRFVCRTSTGHWVGAEASVTETIAITGGRVVPIEGDPVENGTVLLRDGKIAAIEGPGFAAPDGADVVDATGKWVLPGFIDAHAHAGVSEEAQGWAGQDTNERTDPVTAQVRALDAINPADLGFRDAISGGVLAVNVNPGSANPIGGQTVAIKCWGRTVDEMVLREPAGLKSALGENPKRVYGDRNETPSTRLGTAAVIRSAFVAAQNYQAKLAASEDDAVPVDRDLKLEALSRVLRREIPWRQHCHRADDIATAMRMAREFGYDLVIDHGTEAYLLADQIAAASIPVIIGPLFTSRSKVELRNRSLANPGRLAAAGVTIAITTDHPVVPIHFLIHQATLAVKEGLDPVTALRAVTIHPARIIGCADRIGSLAVGKDADLVIWSGDPLDVMSRAERAYVDGHEIYRYDYDRREGVFAPF
jgi:imidazolonepropionase-like amidohydrolase/aryl-alcohol dehydrogenase-like predicted oxidoreductase